LAVPWSRPRVAIALLNRFAWKAQPFSTRLEAVLSLAARTCSLGLLNEARDIYREATRLEPQSPCAWICTFNLSCFLGEERGAISEAQELNHVVRQKDPRVVEVQNILGEWIKARSDRELDVARSMAKRFYDLVPDVAAIVCGEQES